MDFSNKVVVVTGASRGIGREIAVQFAQKGGIVACAAPAVDPFGADPPFCAASGVGVGSVITALLRSQLRWSPRMPRCRNPCRGARR